MTDSEPPSLSVLIEIRSRLRQDVQTLLTTEHKNFLTSLAAANPDWSLLTNPELRNLPALRWKLTNLEKFKIAQPVKCAAQVEQLRRLLFSA